MTGLLFLFLLVPLGVWAWFMRDHLRGVDPRSPLPSKRERALRLLADQFDVDFAALAAGMAYVGQAAKAANAALLGLHAAYAAALTNELHALGMGDDVYVTWEEADDV